MKFVGIDAGSVSVKIVVYDEKGARLYSSYERHKGHPVPVVLKAVGELLRNGLATSESALSVTGTAWKLIASILGIKPVNEIIAQAYATREMFPHIKTIIEMGGEDSKLIILSEESRSVKDFSMNSVCAAGTGSFLDQQAERLRLTIDEFSELALRSKKAPRIAGRCSVFAKSDMIHLQQIATPVEDIVAGLCFAVARNFKGSISRGRKIIPPVSFQGGVAANKGMARAFKEIFKLDEVFVPEDFALLGAIGAVLKDMHDGRVQHFDVSKLEEFIKSSKPFEKGHPPLSLTGTIPSHQTPAPWEPELTTFNSEKKIKAYLGIDVGSISTNLAVIDEQGRLLSKRYLMTAGRPIEAVNQGLSEVGEELGDQVEILGVGTTGSGRYMIADYVGADIVKNEITAHATAAIFIDKTIDTIFEIGGQDSKYISLKDGLVVDFEMNKACAAGTGSFLEEQAEKLNISIKKEFETLALSARNPCRLGERCTVFMENSLMANLQKGADRNDLLAGLAYSIVQNYINKVVAGKPIGKKITFLGGVAFNKAVMAAFEKYLGKKIIVPSHHEVAGAIGMALIAMRHMIAAPSQLSKFKGFELSKKPYEISSFECKGCPNLCEINRVKIKGEEGFLFYGGRCEKYDVRRKKATGVTDLFAFRDEMLWKEHLQRKALFNGQQSGDMESKDAQTKAHGSRARIGIPYMFFFHDYLPFFSSLLWELGFEVEVSPKTNRQVVNLGLEHVLSEACFPVKLAHGHISYLLDKGTDAIFIPSFVNLSTPEERFERGAACPHTQTIPYVSRIAFEGIKTITPVINFRRGRKFLLKELMKAFKPFGIKRNALSNALDSAYRAQNEFDTTIKAKGSEVLSSLNDITIAIVGRSYNALDSGANLGIPRKLADLGILSIPFDFLPLEKYSIDKDWPNMYWKSGQRILKTARFVKETRNLYAIFIGNFLCGTDSFIMKFFKKDMGRKPFLHLEIDEHSADAGVITRCEAFIDSLAQQKAVADYIPSVKRQKKVNAYQSSGKERTLYLPSMSDHVLALVAAFEHCGVRAEALPESDKETAEYGKKFTTGKECYPCTVTTGDMVKKVMQPDFEPEKSAFFMPSGTGPCRFGQYNVFHRLVLDSLGYEQVPIFSPNQDTTFYSDLGIVGKDYTMHAWKGIIAYELLLKSLHETRPYEKQKGSADELYKTYREKLFGVLKHNSVALEKVLQDIRNDFGNLAVQKEEKPLIGVVGEIFVRSHKFSNEDLIRKIEALGGEAWLAPVEEWLYYVNYMGLTKAVVRKDILSALNFILKKHVQKKIEHRLAHHFEGFLKTLHEPETKEIIDMAAPYVHKSFEGETILSMGKTVDLIKKGASGIINAMPFGCMPGTIVTAMLRGVNRDYGIPCMSIPYDGAESSTIEIQLEAFMDQARNYSKRSH